MEVLPLGPRGSGLLLALSEALLCKEQEMIFLEHLFVQLCSVCAVVASTDPRRARNLLD